MGLVEDLLEGLDSIQGICQSHGQQFAHHSVDIGDSFFWRTLNILPLAATETKMESETLAEGQSAAMTGSVSLEPLHVYDWLDQPANDEGERLAKEWLEQFVRPADEKDHQWLDRYLLICDYKGESYVCSGASSMGDVWLRAVGSTNFYDLRVDVQELSEWNRIDRPPAAPKPQRRKSTLAGILAVTATLGGPIFFGGGGRSAAMTRNDPNREKTPEDLERMSAAQRKRDRKAARKYSQNVNMLAPAVIERNLS